MPAQSLLRHRSTLPVALLAGLILSFLVFREVLSALLILAFRDERYTYIAVMPLLCAAVLVLNRAGIFVSPRFSLWGLPFIGLGIGLLATLAPERLGDPALGELTKAGLAVTSVWCGLFVLFLGLNTARRALFPLTLLILTTPLPAAWLGVLEQILQRGSAEFAYVMFKITGMPVFRQGLVFSLPGIDIEVARECSGIRSTMALLVTVLVAGYLLLRSNVNRIVLVLLSLPISMFKNAVRITTLSWLGVYVSPDYLHGELHRHGGLPFTLLALAMVLPVLLFLINRERRRSSAAQLTTSLQSPPHSR